MDAEDRPRQRASKRLLVVAIAAVAAVAALVFALLRFQPLQQAGDLATGGDIQVVTVEEFEEAGAHIVRYADGGYVTYAFTVRNAGPIGVTVTGVELPDESERRLLQPVAVGLSDSGSVDAATMAAFAPFAIAPGEQRRIVVHARFGNCKYYTERAIESVEGHNVEFRIAGVTRSAEVAFARPLLVRSPTIQRCPERTLDRSENRRTDPDD